MSDSEISASPPPADTTAPIIADKLVKYYGDFIAVAEASFAVPKGSVTAFLGPNGAGKSTIMKMLTGFLAPTSGRAVIAGYDMDEQRLEASHQLGYLPENGPLYPEMTPASFLNFVADARGLRGSARKQAIERVIEQCRLAEVWHKSIRKLSKGFRQRVGLAQAIIHDPAVLILDEPTSGLDPNQIQLVRDLVRSFAGHKTVLLSTHILQEVAAMADAVVMISEGRLVFSGTPAELGSGPSLEQRFHELTGGVQA
ncbi:MAG: ABC transporter ATP-binding protein [Planctomycetota bacterium]|nr:MAG: ABC transporter ATP-binding protein [Planctomycetota bacterium]